MRLSVLVFVLLLGFVAAQCIVEEEPSTPNTATDPVPVEQNAEPAPGEQEAPAEPALAEPAPAEQQPPTEPAPADPAPTEKQPPVEAAPVEPAPVEQQPPTEPAPAEPTPAAAKPTNTPPATPAENTETVPTTSTTSTESKKLNTSNKNLWKFPANFMWGTATSSYQIEGGKADRGETIWDTFCADPSKCSGDDGSVAIDHYTRYKDDVKLLANLGTKYYRFSLAWARLFPTADGKVSEKGVAFYHSLIDELKQNGITPLVTLYHWDLPVWVLKKTKGGWVGDGTIADEYEKYARTAFKEFGAKVQWWITINEPWVICAIGYEVGEHAPGENDAPGVKVYKCGHNILRAHARGVSVYRSEFQAKQKGKIGITLDSDFSAAKGGPEAEKAALRGLTWRLGWFANPIWFKDYPQAMRETVGDRLPKFTAAELKSLQGSSDFFGLNHYSTHYVTGLNPPSTNPNPSYWDDRRTIEEKDPKWEKTDMEWSIVPRGFGQLLMHIHKTYSPKGGIIVTENGLAARENSLTEMESNKLRVSFYSRYLGAMHEAISAGVDVRGYMLWSAFDNFEWAKGYAKRFGLYYIDFNTLERTKKPAVTWYSRVIKNNAIVKTWTEDEMGLPKKF